MSNSSQFRDAGRFYQATSQSGLVRAAWTGACCGLLTTHPAGSWRLHENFEIQPFLVRMFCSLGTNAASAQVRLLPAADAAGPGEHIALSSGVES